ncbi:cation diffusion facilitator family transporter [Clostridium manihotivorum]|uniref:Cation transporter n=1 Tax=Clostridium manihotivorum TaxID=2320868 RepID=A0A3R5V918_9CLOT|nr:cation diffusion facilitator family transporter [Clostridium manihotivorum]QAA32968.1 cation transporter [Clostridium manihotivorum]
MNNKVKVARLSLMSNSILIVLKLTVGIFTGSVSIISEAIHSTMDLLAAIIAFFSVKISDKPADELHPYGHGKVENISGVIEALLIFGAAFLIIAESIKKLIHYKDVDNVGIGFLVMFFASVVNFIVSKELYKVAKEEDSIALEADALHLRTDVYTSLGVGIGLLFIWITKLNYLDPIVAILVALFILREAFALLITAFNPLLDVKLSNEEIEVIKNIINKYSSLFCNYHDLKTRKAGRIKYVEMHLVFDDNTSIKAAHDICNKIEYDIEQSLRYTQIMIHLESPE